MANVPQCPNSVKGNGCPKSNPVIEKEGDDFWSFRCLTCKVVYVVSKEGIRDKSRFENAVKLRKQAEEEYQRRMKKVKIFC